jgi:hypothetical protein
MSDIRCNKQNIKIIKYLYLNAYECSCGYYWEDEWDCMCDDRCPRCNLSCSPIESLVLTVEQFCKESSLETVQMHL